MLLTKQFIAWGIFLLPSLFSIATYANSVELDNGIEKICRRREYPDAESVQQLQKEVLQYKSLCREGNLEKWEKLFDSIFTKYLNLDSYLEKSACRDYLMEERRLVFYSKMANSCKSLPAVEFQKLISTDNLPHDTTSHSCWNLTGLTKEGCVRARPCENRANLKYLPLANPEDRVTDSEIVLCNNELMNIERIKDSDRSNISYSEALFSYFTHGEVYTIKEYGAANCHGAAQAISGNFLKDLPVTDLKVWSDKSSASCLEKAKKDGALIQNKSTIKDFDTRGGISVNMNYDKCNVTDCGTASVIHSKCDLSGVKDYILVDNMCIKCWDKIIREKAGMKQMTSVGDWEKLVPGCLLTQRDHSITVLLNNSGLCYFYESSNPSGPSRLNAAPCPELAVTFPYKWCPVKPLSFQLSSKFDDTLPKER